MKYKILTLMSALALAVILSGCGDRMVTNGRVEPDVRPYATTMPRVTTAPNATTRPSATEIPQKGEEGSKTEGNGNVLQEAEKDLERAAEKAKDELSDGEGIVR